jgi:hypothetical protein
LLSQIFLAQYMLNKIDSERIADDQLVIEVEMDWIYEPAPVIQFSKSCDATTRSERYSGVTLTLTSSIDKV